MTTAGGPKLNDRLVASAAHRCVRWETRTKPASSVQSQPVVDFESVTLELCISIPYRLTTAVSSDTTEILLDRKWDTSLCTLGDAYEAGKQRAKSACGRFRVGDARVVHQHTLPPNNCSVE